MTYHIEIVWGAPDDQRKQEVRKALREALTALGHLPFWTERTGRYGRILVNGHQVLRIKSQLPADLTSELTKSVPAYRTYRRIRYFKASLRSTLPAILIAMFPKCPVCWAAYMSILSYIGISSIPYYTWMIYVLTALAAGNIILTLHSAQRTRFYWPLFIQAFAYALILMNRYQWGSAPLTYLSIIMIMTAPVMINLKRNPHISLNLKRYGN